MSPRVVALEDEKVYLSSEELDTTAPSIVRQAELERGVLGALRAEALISP
jgi:hypothetical protein